MYVLTPSFVSICTTSDLIAPEQVVRAKAALADGGHHSSRPCSPRNGGAAAAAAATAGSSSGKGGGTGSSGGDGRAMAFAVGLLDIAIPRDDRVGGSFPRVMINDACVAQAVKGERSEGKRLRIAVVYV